jgi:hypothetical protein
VLLDDTGVDGDAGDGLSFAVVVALVGVVGVATAPGGNSKTRKQERIARPETLRYFFKINAYPAVAVVLKRG